MKALIIFAALCSTAAAACPQGYCDSQQIVERIVVPQRVYVQQQRVVERVYAPQQVQRVIVKERVQRQRIQRSRGFSLNIERSRF
jgi:hypothetical protein